MAKHMAGSATGADDYRHDGYDTQESVDEPSWPWADESYDAQAATADAGAESWSASGPTHFSSGSGGGHFASAGGTRFASPGGGSHFSGAPTTSRGGSHFSGSDTGAHASKRDSNIVSNVLIVIGAALLVAAGVLYFYNQHNYDQIEVKNEAVAEYARLSDDGQEPPGVDWESLRSINPDIVGWLQIPGTIVNYPVYQTTDNDYYLDHAPDRTESIGGSVFLDYQSVTPGMVESQTIIYGHHMRNGSQFKPVADMDSQELFDGVGRIWYVTEQGAWDLAPLFLFYTTDTDVNVRQFSFGSLDEFRTYLRTYYAGAVTKRSDAEQIIAGADKVLTLSTCNYYDGAGRTVLVCVPRYSIPGTPEYDQYHAVTTVEPQVEETPAQEVVTE